MSGENQQVHDVYEFEDIPAVYVDQSVPPGGSNTTLSDSSPVVKPTYSCSAIEGRSTSISIHIGPPPIKQSKPFGNFMGCGSCSTTTNNLVENGFELEHGLSEGSLDSPGEKKMPPLRMRIVLSKNSAASSPGDSNKLGGNNRKRVALGDDGVTDLSQQSIATRSRIRSSKNAERESSGVLLTSSSYQVFEPEQIEKGAASSYDDEETTMDSIDDFKSIGENNSGNDDDSSNQQATVPGEVEPSSNAEVAAKLSNSSHNGLLGQSSFDQSLNFKAMIESNWIKAYKEQQEKLIEAAMNSKNSASILLMQDVFNIAAQTKSTEIELRNEEVIDWPENTKKLALELAQRRFDLSEDHRFERKRLLEFGQREYHRIVQRDRLRLLSVVKILKDSEIYNYENFMDECAFQSNLSSLDSDSQLQQLSTRLKRLAESMENRQETEAEALFVCQKAEWEKAWKCYQKKEGSSEGAHIKFNVIASKMNFIMTRLRVEHVTLPPPP